MSGRTPAPGRLTREHWESLESFADRATELDPRRLLWGVLMLLAVPVFGVFVHLPAVARLDRGVLDALVAVRTPALTETMLVLTNVFAPTAAITWTILLGVLIRVLTGSWREGLFVPATMAASAGITALIKEIVERIRPAFPERLVVEGSHSFPSGHTTAVAAVAVAGAILVIAHLADRTLLDEGGVLPAVPGRTLKGIIIAGAIMLILLIGFTRLYLGAHWFSDVIAGGMVGTATSLITAELLFRDL